jgi:hypothetical protein
MKSVTMISWELHPFHTLGGTAYAIRRLADQFTDLNIKTRVLLPDCLETFPGKNLSPLLMPRLLKMRAEQLRAPRLLQCSEFSRAALEAVEQISVSGGSDAVIAHSLEGAIPIILRNGDRSGGPSVFWLHSLYDPPISDLSKDERRLLPTGSLLSSAVMMADIVVTSTGILKDAREFEWPDRLKELQHALIIASAEHRVLTVESMGCLPVAASDSQNERRAVTLCSFSGSTFARQRFRLFRRDCGTTASARHRVCCGATPRAFSNAGEAVSQRSYLLVALAHPE